jgi:membrane-associated phospholipid phosphatase
MQTGIQDNFAKSVGFIFNAPLIAVVAFGYIYREMTLQRLWSYFYLPAFFSGILPILVLYYLRRIGKIGDMMVNDREQRFIPFASVFGSYLMGAIALWVFNAPLTMMALMISYVITSLVMMLITLRWKISIHAAGVAGPSMFLVLRYNLVLWPFLIMTLLVCWSRWRLKVHTIQQVFGGAVLSVVVTTIMVNLLPLV